MAEGDSYATLLQPIRDLAQNWSIDVASALGDYLEELDGITVTLGEELREAVTDPLTSDDATDTVNFAQAALLIQASKRPLFINMGKGRERKKNRCSFSPC